MASFQISMLEDEERLIAAGPWPRLLALRKWLYMGAALAIPIRFDTYDEAASKALFRVFTLPETVLTDAVFWFLTYVLLQYLSLIRIAWPWHHQEVQTRLIERQTEAWSRAEAHARSFEKRIEREELKADACVKELNAARNDQERMAIEARRGKALYAASQLRPRFEALQKETARHVERAISRLPATTRAGVGDGQPESRISSRPSSLVLG
ncbi:MAG: hypothetical protein ACK4YQ_17020 [Phenylobacterium sp.]|uniref:hypothetical protein n=1 Tax=Phenylobacterium sp. TaxID=1871053 RepID=UPI00391CA179